jgi:hypothetical protein
MLHARKRGEVRIPATGPKLQLKTATSGHAPEEEDHLTVI